MVGTTYEVWDDWKKTDEPDAFNSRKGEVEADDKGDQSGLESSLYDSDLVAVWNRASFNASWCVSLHL